MKNTNLFTLLFCLFLLPVALSAQSYSEPPDLSNTAPGNSLTFSGPTMTVSGQMNTPGDGSEYFTLTVPTGCSITGVNYSITDPYALNITGYFQFGVNNQEQFTGATSGSFANATQFPTNPFPLNGPTTVQCQASTNISFQSDWAMTFLGTCAGGCVDPDVPSLVGPSGLLCPGAFDTLFISGSLNDATAWHIYSGTCGGIPVTTTVGNLFVYSPASTTTYFVRGEGGCVTPGTCAQFTVNVGDSVPPYLTCPPNTTDYLDPFCSYTLPDFSNMITNVDFCDPNPTVTQSPAVGTNLTPDQYQVSITSTDASGNSDVCIFVLTVLDTLSPLDTSVTRTGDSLSANLTGMNYQWVDCNNGFSPLAGDTAQLCATSLQQDGSYAVIITQGNCVDTSSCYTTRYK